MRNSLRTAALAAVASMLPVSANQAASVDINPVRIDLFGEDRPAELRLTNTGSTELAVQIDTLKWDQDLDGVDSLLETSELLVVPPLFTVPPGEQQIVRIGFLGESNPLVEQSYRLLVTELSPPNNSENAGSALTMRMRFSIPAFVAPQTVVARPEISLREVSESDGGTLMVFENSGNGHVRLANFQVRTAEGWEVLPEAMKLRYLLPGTVTSIEVPAEMGPLTVVRFVTSDGQDWEYAVPSQL